VYVGSWRRRFVKVLIDEEHGGSEVRVTGDGRQQKEAVKTNIVYINGS
jgi:hypothetical protein